jgi:hypothetical protein
MEITLQYSTIVPTGRSQRDRLRQVLAELGRPEEEIRRQPVETAEEAERVAGGIRCRSRRRAAPRVARRTGEPN